MNLFEHLRRSRTAILILFYISGRLSAQMTSGMVMRSDPAEAPQQGAYHLRASIDSTIRALSPGGRLDADWITVSRFDRTADAEALLPVLIRPSGG
jgi:hypothetical protein